ncbi:MAG: leucyl aminopeptidase [Pelagibacterales bacterium]|nr:leucyl aminopeptidase [Pelagibacterales bacterium]PPR17163.1 MAG: Cytosol aminopeptidase [Alphaproteobacteria bacterium MarineAlpha9_Bin3]|tara:strand:+ start:5865 stop:7361 length:1497 start_codon:yes stop_codon:yes gene_type:complete
MTFKVSFNSEIKSNTGLILIILDDSLQLTDHITKLDKKYDGILSDAVKLETLSKKGGSKSLYYKKGKEVKEILLYNIGNLTELSIDNIDIVGGEIFSLLSNSVKSITICCSINKKLKMIQEEFATKILHGIKLRSYTFYKYKLKSKNKFKSSLTEVELIVKDINSAKKYYNPLKALEEGVFLTRNLVSEPANILTPKTLAEEAEKLKKLGVKVEVLKLAQIKRLKMGALLGVAMGSANEPRVVSMSWNGTKNKKSKPEVCFVGKGVTFDTGGISIKPSGGMEDMKWDMGGSGVVIGLMKALAGRKANVNVTAVVGLVENMPSGKAQRPGDVVIASSGHSIEVINTDAEGRLVLADAVTYAIRKFKPKRLIDLATLTGAVIVSLGPQRAGVFSNNDELASNIFDSGEKTGEKVWRMPVGKEYDDDIKSPIADMKNVGSGRGAGATSGAKFIEQFVKDIPWAHIDIAGVTWSKSNSKLFPTGGTGFGVRLLNTYVKDFIE